MLTKPLRAAMLAGALSVCSCALALTAPLANAVPQESQITVPEGAAYAFYDATESPPAAFKVEGTTPISGPIALRCYYGTGSKSYTLVGELTPSGGGFSAEVKASLLPFGPCVLRAVPHGDTEAHPPGTEAEEATDPYKGPRVAGSRFEPFQEGGAAYDYELDASTLSSFLSINSVGDCGLSYSQMFAPETLAAGALFGCDAALFPANSVASGKATRSELQIDGANAYSPAAAGEVENAVKAKIPGAPQLSVTKTFNAATHLATVTEIDPIVKCAPSTAFPPSASSCREFVSAGVQLEREWQTGNGDQVAAMTDKWSSTNGATHSLNALYDQETANEGPQGGAYQFAGTNVFAPTTKGETVTLPAGLGRIYYRSDAETPAAGDGLHPQGAIVYDTPPSEPILVYGGTQPHGSFSFNGFVMPYQATIPSSGSYTLHMTFIQAYKLAEVETLASETLAHFPPSPGPSLSITAPANGITVATPNVTVSGTLTDPRAITSFTVDGQPVSVGGGGAWSASVPLLVGANTIKALATDQAGLSAERSVSVTYRPTPPVAHAAQVGVASGANDHVTFTIACTGEAGASCEVESTLTTFERFRGGRPVAVAARRHYLRTHSERVTVGSSKLTIPAGQRVTIAIQLNEIGRALLARFGALPVHLSVVQTSAGRRATIIAQNLTVRKHHRRHRHRRHHHRH